MRGSLLAALLLGLAAGALPAAAGADDVQPTEAVGQAPIAGDLLAARDRAKDDALRNCVQQVAATVVTAAAEPDQAQLLGDRIYARAVGYIRRFTILEDRQDESTWVTKARCEVAAGKLEDDLLASGIAYRRAGMPRVLVLVAEGGIQASAVTGWWQGGGTAAELHVVEKAFVDRMEKSGFTFVDAEALQGKAKLDGLGAEPSVAQARELGVKSGAELVVVGRAIARPLGQLPADNGALYSSAASVSARAVRVDTGEVVAAVDLTAPAGKGFDQAAAGRSALAEAGRALAREMFSRVGRAWTRQQSGVKRLSMTVKGVADYGRLAAFKSVLVRSVRGVKDVQERSMEDGMAELEVALSVSAQAFATELATRKFQGFTVKVRKVTADAVEVELQ